MNPQTGVVASAHVPVMLDRVLDCWLTDTDGTYVDCTYGRGGHSRALLERLGAAARLYVIDRDPVAIEDAAALASADPRVVPLHGRFGNLNEVLAARVDEHLAGVLFDFGVSSPQLDEPERGFSFMNDGPLDMRMDPSRGPTAAEWLNSASVDEMARVFKTYGEERFAGRIARAIERERPLFTTLGLAQVVEAAQPSRTPQKHGATRVFQAVRIHVNSELDEIRQGLTAAFERLAPGGRLVTLSFHSLEDRIVKHTFRSWTHPDPGPRRLPTREIVQARAILIAKATRASGVELQGNPRARSATLRAVERLAVSA